MSAASGLLPALSEQLALDENALAELLEILATARAAVADADAALQSARQVQNHLEARVAQQQRAIAAQRQFLCPMTKLPDEMIATIMRILHDDRTDTPIDADWYLEATSVAVRCASVCQRWRTLALSFPWLWNHVYVNLAVGDGIPATRNLVGLQFQRSAPLPLDIWIDCVEASPDADTFRDILGQSARWRTVQFIHHALEDVLPYFQRPTPLLELFSLRDQWHPSHGRGPCLPPGQAVEFLPYAPKLDRLELPACTLHRLALLPRPSLHRLALAGCYSDWPQSLLSNLLATCPSLESANLYPGPPEGPRFPTRLTNATLLHLTELTIHLDLALSCMDVLSLPTLQCLTVTCYKSRRALETEVLFQKYARIRKLSLLACDPEDVTPGRLPFVLAHLPKLESLHLSDFILSRDDFAPLAVPDARGDWIAPKLKTFHVKEAYLDAMAASRCVSFVRSRTVGNSGPDSKRARLTEATCALNRSHPRGVFNGFFWDQDVLSTVPGWARVGGLGGMECGKDEGGGNLGNTTRSFGST